MSDDEKPPPADLTHSVGRSCPICGKPAIPGGGAFCSKRCADIDLGRWLKDIYRVPTNEAPSDGEQGDGGEA
jgi:endogenous inhibitor of DNA gyrase (YacG/DUF329 family)